MPVPARRPGPSLKLAVGLMIAGVLVGVLCVVLAVRGFVQAFTGPIRSTPTELVLNAKKATYAVYERTGTQSIAGGFTNSESRSSVLGPRDVSVTGPDGRTIETRRPGNVTETITRNRKVFTATVRFTVPAAGRYTVRIGGLETEVIVARTLGDSFRSAVPYILGAVTSGLALLVGLVLLIVGSVRRRNASAPVAAVAAAPPYMSYPPASPGMPGPPRSAAPPPAAGWYPDPWDARFYRYYDGEAWSGHTSPRQG
jgi:Protein of unknown function (DUF2510)